MTFEADLRAHLLGQTEAGARIHPVLRPQQGQAGLPAITYQRIAGVPQTNTDANEEMLNIREQVDVWATTHDAAKAIAEAVRVRMQTPAATFRAVLLLDQDLYEDETRIFRVSMDFSCWYRVA